MTSFAKSSGGLDRTAVLAFIDQMFGFRPPDDDPDPIGPWGPVLRKIFVSGPIPDPWSAAFHAPRSQFERFHLDHSLQFLNPQPLPPLPALMLEALITRAELIADVGKAIGANDAAPKYVHMMVDDLCPTPRLWKYPPSPPKGGDGGVRPPRPNELVLDASGLLLLGAGLRNAAAWTAHKSLATAFVDMGTHACNIALEKGVA